MQARDESETVLGRMLEAGTSWKALLITLLVGPPGSFVLCASGFVLRVLRQRAED